MKTKLKKSGFTIVEIALFLALSGFLMIGLILSANASISRQRYTDSVNNFADFLKGAYTDVLNVSNYSTDSSSNFNGGRSTTAIYGKFIVFGETPAADESEATIYSYDVVGTAVSSSEASSLMNKYATVREMMASSEINAAIIDNSNCKTVGSCANSFYKMESYTMPWDARAEQGTNASDGQILKAAVLIVRSPVTGTIRTYTYAGDVFAFHSSLGPTGYASRNKFKEFISDSSKLKEQVLDICVDSDDNANSNRRDVRILERASNSSGVFLAEMDTAFNATSAPEGSVCFGRG